MRTKSRDSNGLKAMLDARDQELRRVTSRLEEAKEQLQEKEAVIQELAAALGAFRRAQPLLECCTRPTEHLRRGWRLAIERVRKALRPRLGTLDQHAPRPLRLPAKYYRSPVLAELPRVSLVTPSFNQGRFIARTVDSVLAQGYPDLQYVVQDGGSSDDTTAVLRRYPQTRLTAISEPDGGQSQAINRGFARTDGEIMGWLNSDDILLPNALNAVVSYFNRHPDVDVVYGNRLLIDEQDRVIGRWVLPGHDSEVLSWADWIPQETLFWRRRIWDRAGGAVDESFRFAMDWDLLLRFRDHGARFHHMRRYLGAFRIHDHQKTSAVINDIGHQEMNRLRKRVIGRVPAVEEINHHISGFLRRHVLHDLFLS